MPGCCLGALVLMLGPRVVLFAAWLLSNWYVAFDSTPVAVVGWLFAPWTSLAWQAWTSLLSGSEFMCAAASGGVGRIFGNSGSLQLG